MDKEAKEMLDFWKKKKIEYIGMSDALKNLIKNNNEKKEEKESDVEEKEDEETEALTKTMKNIEIK